MAKIQRGTVKRHPDGFGFFISDNPEDEDVYISRKEMVGVMTNDHIEIEVLEQKGRTRGRVLQVDKRAVQNVVGKLFVMKDGSGQLLDEGHSWGCTLRISKEHLNEATDQSMVAVEIVSYPSEENDFQGKVVEVLNSDADPYTDVKRVLFSHNISQKFPEDVEKEAEHIHKSHRLEQELSERKDLRELSFITIDGVTAKDFDDAISIQTLDKGFLLHVAIADVSHYVKLGTPIDKEAVQRGTSTYFPHYVVPMLPEVLSNDLCSLKPNVPRLTLVAEMRLDFSGDLSESSFYEAVIESKARVTYGEAQEVIDGDSSTHPKNIQEVIQRASDVAKLLMAKRHREGSLDLEIPETEVVLDELGNPVDIIKSERLFSHKVIEELMLIANVAVAQFFTKKEVPAIYRIHEEPRGESIELLQKFLFNFGGKKKLSGGRLQKKISKALQDFHGEPEAQVLNILTLRSMMQAKYSPDNVGHFGLGFQNYTHFTSPIRRYPDLIVHRLLKKLIMPTSSYKMMSYDDLKSAGTTLSACEQRSIKAERQFYSIKKARFMASRVGEEFDGVISSVAKFGVFVLLRVVDVDGLVKVEDLGGEKFEFDEENLRLVGARSGKIFAIGQALQIQIAGVDIDQGQIDFVLAGEDAVADTRHRKTNNKDSAKRRKTSNNRGRVRKARVSKRRRKD